MLTPHVSPPTGAALPPHPQSSSLPQKLIGGVRRNASSFSLGNNHKLERLCHAIKLDSAWLVCVREASLALFAEKSLIPGGPQAKSIQIFGEVNQ